MPSIRPQVAAPAATANVGVFAQRSGPCSEVELVAEFVAEGLLVRWARQILVQACLTFADPCAKQCVCMRMCLVGMCGVGMIEMCFAFLLHEIKRFSWVDKIWVQRRCSKGTSMS